MLRTTFLQFLVHIRHRSHQISESKLSEIRIWDSYFKNLNPHQDVQSKSTRDNVISEKCENSMHKAKHKNEGNGKCENRTEIISFFIWIHQIIHLLDWNSSWQFIDEIWNENQIHLMNSGWNPGWIPGWIPHPGHCGFLANSSNYLSWISSDVIMIHLHCSSMKTKSHFISFFI